MAEYTRAIDEQISQLLRQRGAVTPDMLAGLAEHEAAELLARYVQVHEHEVAFVFDGRRLTWSRTHESSAVPVPPPVTPMQPPSMPSPEGGVPLSPVDQLMSSSSDGKALLDVEASGGRYPSWAWWPPFIFGLLGGLFSWLIVRDANPRAASRMLVTGLVVQVVSACIGLVLAGSVLPQLGQLSAGAGTAAWPPSSSGRVTFYYFGTST